MVAQGHFHYIINKLRLSQVKISVRSWKGARLDLGSGGFVQDGTSDFKNDFSGWSETLLY